MFEELKKREMRFTTLFIVISFLINYIFEYSDLRYNRVLMSEITVPTLLTTSCRLVDRNLTLQLHEVLVDRGHMVVELPHC